ncbi:HNH endonuclease signature motif containing protein [Georgenia alba]|uniref:DUF222 domain-containing protein n=1 Tax=Georgenia alba TaxID=2233858 RepID=A0ABW2Q9E2_9MICO
MVVVMDAPAPARDEELGNQPCKQQPRKQRSLDEVESELSSLAAGIAAATCTFLLVLAEFDARGGWARARGMVSTAQWLSWRCGMSASTAREHVRIARALPALPMVTEAFAAGRLSYSKVRAISRVATTETEEDLLQIAHSATANQLDRFCSGVRTAMSVVDVNERHDRRHLTFRNEADGSISFSGRCSPEDGAAILEALRRAQDELDRAHLAESREDRHVVAGRALVDALVLVCEQSDVGAQEPELPGQLEHAVARGSRRSETVIHVTPGDLASAEAQQSERQEKDLLGPRLEQGLALHPETARRLTCDTGVVVQLHEEEPGCSLTPNRLRGRTLDVGRRRRTPNAAQFRALWDRDQGCRFPGCERRRYVHAHHIVHWADGGPTDLDNLVLLCGQHHRLHHEGGFEIARGHGDDLAFVSENGSRVTAVPESAAPTAPDVLPATADAPSLAPINGGHLDLEYSVSVVAENWAMARRRAS